MRKKNSNSSVPSGMHSLAQRSQQERRQKMEQQRVRTAPQEPMRVPPQQPAHFGRQPMQQVPPPPVQKPEKALSQEALQELQQQATQQPEESAVYNRFFADISVEERRLPKSLLRKRQQQPFRRPIRQNRKTSSKSHPYGMQEQCRRCLHQQNQQQNHNRQSQYS